MERNYNYDVSSYFSLCGVVCTWFTVELWEHPNFCGTAPKCREAKSEGDVRVDPIRDAPTGLERTHIYLTPFDAVQHVPAFRPSTIGFAQTCSTNMG